MLITVMAKSLNLSNLINHLTYEELDNPRNQDDDNRASPFTYVTNRSFFHKLQSMLESELILDYVADDEDIPFLDSNSRHFLDETIEELVDQIGNFLETHELIATIPLDSRGMILMVLTARH